MYADYHQLYVAGKTPKNLQTVLSADIELATTWYKENLLLTNHEKYQAMTITGGPSDDTTIAEKVKPRWNELSQTPWSLYRSQTEL